MKSFKVYAGWLDPEEHIGTCYIETARGNEVISFSYSPDWLLNHPGFVLDPDLMPAPGRQYPSGHLPCFGFLEDVAPDRWGRTLMNRREVIEAREAGRPRRRMRESDYILGVHDAGRIGGLRFKDPDTREYITNDGFPAPPMTELRRLEYAATSLDASQPFQNEKWLKDLINPGSSLGGARPKANVADEKGDLWIAKFPSRRDETDVGAWEMVAHDLAVKCGIKVPPAKVMRLSDTGSTFLVQRFDRVEGSNGNSRIHFASAMTMLRGTDGTNEEYSYLDIADAIEKLGTHAEADLKEMWSRIAFNVCISNTDDHLRNHGFLSRKGWRLSPAYDVNPVPDDGRLSLCIDFDNPDKDPQLVLSVAEMFRLIDDKAKVRMTQIQETVRENWKPLATRYGISRNEQEMMKDAFSAAGQGKGYAHGFSFRNDNGDDDFGQ